MRKKLFTLLSLLALIGVWAWAENTGTSGGGSTIAKIGNTEYATIQDAFNACTSGTETTITLLANVEEGASFGFPDDWKDSGRKIVLDLNGKTYKFMTPAMGSTGYESQAMHLINGNELTVKNGTLAINSETTVIKRLIQNYCDLTLENVTVDTENVPDNFSNYNNSFCRGTVTLKGNTVFKASPNAIIFDIDGSYCSKQNGGNVELVIDNSFTGSISGKIEYVESTNANYTSTLTDNANYLKAKIGNDYFATVEEAVSYAANGATIELIKDANTDKQIEIAGKEIVLDLNGHKIQYNGTTTLSSGVLLVHNGAGLTVKGEEANSEISAGDKAYAAIALTKKGDDATNPAKLTVESGKITGYYYGIVGSGSRHNTEITINGGTIYGTCANDNLGIYHPQDGKLTINGGNIKGYASAVEMRAGTLNITNGTFNSTATTTTVAANGSGNTTVGAAIAIAQHTTKKAINVTISGGEFNGNTGLTVFNPQNNDDAEHVNVTISGGTINGVRNGINAKYGTVNISGGTIEGKSNIGVAVDKCTVNISGTAVINSQEFTVGTGYGTGAIVNISGGTLTASDNAVIGGNGNKTDKDNNNAVRENPNKFNISGGTFNGGIKTADYVACGIYAPWKDEFNITGGTFNITGGAGIVARAGVVNVSDNVEIKCTGNVTGKVGDSRIVVTCSPIVFDCDAKYPAMTDASMITVTGGKFSSDNGTASVNIVNTSGDTNKRIVLLGGSFSSDPNKFCAEGYNATKGDGTAYVVEKIKAVEIPAPTLSETNVKIEGSEGGETTTIDRTTAENTVSSVVKDNSAVTNFDTTPASESLSMNDAAPADTDEKVTIGNSEVDVKNKTLVELIQQAATAANVSEVSKNNIEASDINQIVKIEFSEASVKNEGSNVVVGKISFNIKPTAVVMVEDKKVELPVPNALIANPITFRLPVDNNTQMQFVRLYHKADGSETEEDLGLYEIRTDENGNKYIEVSAKNFSEYGYTLSETSGNIDVYLGTATKETKAVGDWETILEATPNAIAVVSSELATWAGRTKNVLVKYTAGSQDVYECPHFELTDLKEFYTPVEFKAITGSYNRQPNAADVSTIEYNSVCLPFAFSASELSETATILTFAYYDNVNTAYFNKVTNISAGNPCIIQETETSWKKIDLAGKTIVASPNMDGNMRGTFVTTNAYGKDSEGKTEYYSVGADNKFSPLADVLKPFRSCLWLHNDGSIGQGSASAKAIRIIEDGEVTGIESVVSSDIESREIYTINGMKVSGNAKSLPRGMYIMNGKKFIVR